MGTRANGLKTQRYTVIAVMHLKLSLFLVVIAAAAAKKPRYNEIVPNKVGRVAEVTSKQSPQSLTCYDNYDGRGDSLQMYDYAPTLFSTEVNFNNRFSSCCFSGVWLLYDNPFYNQGAFFDEEFDGWGENYCTNFDSRFDNRASSVRFCGAPDGYKYDTLNLYEGERFMGKEHYYYDNYPAFDLDNLMRSAIVTGCSAWTIYEYDNYQGDSVCLYPADTVNCYPGFFPYDEDLINMANKGSSARKGCYSNKKLVGKARAPNALVGEFQGPQK